MKKILSLLCSFALLCSLGGCSARAIHLREALNIARDTLNGYDEIINIYELGNISKDENNVVLDEYGDKYFVVNNNKYKSIDDLIKSTQEVCTYKFSSSYFYRVFENIENKGRSFYKDINGKLCRAYGDMSILYTPKNADIKIHQYSSKVLVFSVPPAGYDSKTVTYRFYFTVLSTNEGWRIDNVYEVE